MSRASKKEIARAEKALAELISRAATLKESCGMGLLVCFAGIPDLRGRRGRRHSLPCIMALCTAAVLCGNTTIADVTAWVHAAPQDVLARTGAKREDRGSRVALHPDTVIRLFARLGAQELARQAGMYLARRARPGPVTFPVSEPCLLPSVKVDGKAVRGAAGPDGMIP